MNKQIVSGIDKCFREVKIDNVVMMPRYLVNWVNGGAIYFDGARCDCDGWDENGRND